MTTEGAQGDDIQQKHQLKTYSELAFHPSEEIHSMCISPLIEVIPHDVTTKAMLYDLSELHGRSTSKPCFLGA